MKLVLIMYICSVVSNTCMPPIQAPETYNNWYECSLSGYQKSLDILNEMSKDQVNEHQIYTKFFCKENVTT